MQLRHGLAADGAARGGDDAIAAPVIAAVLYFKKGAGAHAKIGGGAAFEILAFFVLRDADNALTVERERPHQLRQGGAVACPGDDIGFRDGGGLPREGLRVAAGEHHDGAGIFPTETADSLAGLAVAFGGDGAAAHHIDIVAGGVPRDDIKAFGGKAGGKHLSFVLVDLAAKGIECDAHGEDLRGWVQGPWYDNYCFAPKSLEKENRMFNCDMVLYYLRNYMNNGCPPRQMVDPNTRTDYGKMKKLLQFDRLDGSRIGMIRKIAEEGQITTRFYESFSAFQIPDPYIFPSLLFYYGMLTFKAIRGEKVVLSIPNNNVRKQYYGYLEEEFQKKSSVNTELLTDYFYDMAYDGVWQHALQFMADAYTKVSSVRDGIEAERNLQGFFMAYFNLTDYYYTAPELELNHGFCDFFLLPDLTHYATKHSYILELKMLHKGDTEATAKKQWAEAVAQMNVYAQAPRVEALRQGTILHKIIMQFDGHRLKRMEEV